MSDTDIAIIGGGLAGLSAAVRAAELGARVAVLEQGGGEAYPCNSRYSGGIVHVAFRDLDLPADELVASLRQICPDDPDIDFGLVELLARNMRRGIAWFASNAGARFVRAGPAAWEKWYLAPPRPAQTELVWLGRGPDLVLRRLREKLTERGGRFLTGHKISSVIRNDQGRFSLRTVAEDGAVEARAIIVADGGFQSNAALLRAHVSQQPDRLLQRNAGTGTGAGLSLAESLGAQTRGLSSFYGHLLARDAMTNPHLWPYPMLDPIATAGIVVGRDGRRFADEGKGGVYLANQLARTPNPLESFIVIDERIWTTLGTQHRIPVNPLLRDRGGLVFTAGTFEELARQAGIDAGLADTVSDYNKAVLAGRSADLSPCRSPDSIKPHAIEISPFYAVPVCVGITATMGGLRVDSRMNVFGRDDRGIDGVFAAGGTVGGFEGGASAFYLGGLSKALVTGLLAGEAARAYVADKGN